MKINKLVIFLLSFTISLFCYSQKDVINYYSFNNPGGKISQPLYAFTVLKMQSSYTFLFKPDTTYIAYANNKTDTIITTKSFGPYKFSKRGAIIYLATKVGSNSEWNYREFYILKSSELFLIPNLFSSTIDSYTIKCKYLGTGKVAVNNKFEKVYIFNEETKEGKKIFRRKAYISRTTYLPVKIEYFSGNDYLHPSSTLYQMESQSK